MGRILDTKTQTTTFTALFGDFAGELDRWRSSFYELWRYQMTFHFAYEINLREDIKYGVYVEVVPRPQFVDETMKWMTELGYQNIRTAETTVGEIWSLDHEDLRDVDTVAVED